MRLGLSVHEEPIIWGPPMVYVRPVKAYEPMYGICKRALDSDSHAQAVADGSDTLMILANVWAVKDEKADGGWAFYTAREVSVP